MAAQRGFGMFSGASSFNSRNNVSASPHPKLRWVPGRRPPADGALATRTATSLPCPGNSHSPRPHGWPLPGTSATPLTPPSPETLLAVPSGWQSRAHRPTAAGCPLPEQPVPALLWQMSPGQLSHLPPQALLRKRRYSFQEDLL